MLSRNPRFFLILLKILFNSFLGGGNSLHNVNFDLLIEQKFKLKLKVFIMNKAVSNRDICFIKAVLLLCKHGHFSQNFACIIVISPPPHTNTIKINHDFYLGWTNLESRLGDAWDFVREGFHLWQVQTKDISKSKCKLFCIRKIRKVCIYLMSK